jgi:predicted phage tail protein
MNNENTNELVNAINRLANVIRGGVYIIAGAILLSASWFIQRPGSGFVDITSIFLTSAGFGFLIWLGFKQMQ